MVDALILVFVLVCLVLVMRRADKHPSAKVISNQPAPQPVSGTFETGLPSRFVVLDFETTGLFAERHEIIEIGAIKVTLNEEVHPTFEALIVPKKRVSSRITQLTGLDRKTLVRDGGPIEEILPQFLAFCENLPVVAFNAKFDRGFLVEACSACEHPFPTGQWICALELSRKAWPRRSSYRLSALARDGGCDMTNEHRAIGDCKRALEVLMMAVVEMRSRGVRAI